MHWTGSAIYHHKVECQGGLKTNLKHLPHPLRLLLNLIWLKTDTQNKDFMKGLMHLNTKVAKMISNASLAVQSSDDKKEEVMNYALIVFLRAGDSFEINLENFKLIVHLYFISVCNGFGIADD